MARTGLRPRKVINAKSYLIDLISKKKISHNFCKGYQFVVEFACFPCSFFLLCADFFSKTNFSKPNFQEYHLSVSLDLEQAHGFFKLFVKVISKQHNLPQAEKC